MFGTLAAAQAYHEITPLANHATPIEDHTKEAFMVQLDSHFYTLSAALTTIKAALEKLVASTTTQYTSIQKSLEKITFQVGTKSNG